MMQVHVFKGKGKVYGFTLDATGANLPASHGPWTPSKSIDMQRGETPRIAVNTDAALDNIEKHGFHLQGVSIVSTEGIAGA
ncbi:hypothetical protein [Sphingorhabdus sp.]|uniref:hypothetical protein n=1 Tax=Sphingorhabdus sp. TaxID=1902408 RepID=UPI003D81A73D